MFALFDTRDNLPPDPARTGIWIKTQGNSLTRITMFNGNVYWLTFILMFPFGDLGWQMRTPMNCDDPHPTAIPQTKLADAAVPEADDDLLNLLSSTNTSVPYLTIADIATA
jgi:hypothetical protein